jgi:hypothetical protein
MFKKTHFTVLMAAVLALLLVISPAAAQDKVQVVWFIGLGTGTNTEQLAAQE